VGSGTRAAPGTIWQKKMGGVVEGLPEVTGREHPVNRHGPLVSRPKKSRGGEAQGSSQAVAKERAGDLGLDRLQGFIELQILGQRRGNKLDRGGGGSPLND